MSPQIHRPSLGHPAVLGVVGDPVGIARLHEAFGDDFRLLTTSSELESYLDTHLVDLIIVEPWDRVGHALAPLVRRISRQQHAPPIAVYVDRRPESIHETLHLGEAGATQLVVRDLDDNPSALRRLTAASTMSAVVSDAIDLAAAAVPEKLFKVVQFCLANANGHVTAADIGHATGVHPRTVVNWTRPLRLTGIRAVVSRCKLAIAIGLLLREERSTEQVALTLGFSSTAALRNMLMRHTGLRPREVTEHGDFAYWCHRLLANTPSRDASVNAQRPRKN
jgi:AraC-like DNA-binding protein